MPGTPALPAALMAGVSATLSTGSTMIAFTPCRTICWMAEICASAVDAAMVAGMLVIRLPVTRRSEEHTSELQSQSNLVCRLLLEKKNKKKPHQVKYTMY